jgi:hypothetical protein
MISEERDERRGRHNLLWALLLSAAIHATLLPLGLWLTGLHVTMLAPRQPEREMIVASTAVRIEKRSVPQPRSPLPQPRPIRAQRQLPQPRRVQAARPAAPRHELARSAPSAPPQPKVQKPQPHHAQSSLQQQIAQQERTFSQEVAQLNQRNNPLSIATSAPRPPTTYRRSFFDVPGRLQRDAVQAVLIPLSHWYTHGLSCYYTRYVAQFTNGGNEQGTIPWPVCYPANDDRMAHPPYPHALPIPVPQPDYVLPAGTYLTPLLRSVYDMRG